MQTIGSTLLKNWNGIEKPYRATSKNIISYALNHDIFDEAELAKKLIAKVDVDVITESVQSLVNANILSDFCDGTYSLHSKVEKEYLLFNMNKLR